MTVRVLRRALHEPLKYCDGFLRFRTWRCQLLVVVGWGRGAMYTARITGESGQWVQPFQKKRKFSSRMLQHVHGRNPPR